MFDAKEMFRKMVTQKYLDRKNIKDISLLRSKTKEDLNMASDVDFERLLSEEEREVLKKENSKVKIEAELRKMVDKTSFSMDWDIRS